ncbi:MAG: metal-dependent hydrolase [Candidatus Moranbacteria bacterium]|nr:metal-dependent hydrolase [Candidatus Moranbacteria bacterium]
MAGFRTHTTVGAFVGAAILTIALLSAVVSDPVAYAGLFFAAIVGSFLPDIDSDSGLPFQIIFGVLGFVGASLGVAYVYKNIGTDFGLLMLSAGVVFFLVRFVCGALFKKFSRHRGIFHSLPMAFVAGLLVLLGAKFYCVDSDLAIIFCVAVIMGYVSHLILDEIYAGINVNGKGFLPNKALGSALKLWSGHARATLIMYFILVFLLFVTREELYYVWRVFHVS